MPVKKRSRIVYPEYNVADLVFAKVQGFPHWPARIDYVKEGSITSKKYSIFFFGTQEVAQLSCKEVFLYKQYKEKYGQQRTRKYFNDALIQIETEPSLGFKGGKKSFDRLVAKSAAAVAAAKLVPKQLAAGDYFEVSRSVEALGGNVDKKAERQQKKEIKKKVQAKKVTRGEPCSDDDIIIPAAKEKKKKNAKRKLNYGDEISLKPKHDLAAANVKPDSEANFASGPSPTVASSLFEDDDDSDDFEGFDTNKNGVTKELEAGGGKSKKLKIDNEISVPETSPVISAHGTIPMNDFDKVFEDEDSDDDSDFEGFETIKNNLAGGPEVKQLSEDNKVPSVNDEKVTKSTSSNNTEKRFEDWQKDVKTIEGNNKNVKRRK